jgi:molecular chaperone IbpA
MLDLLFTAPSSAYSKSFFNPARSTAHEMDLVNAALDVFTYGKDHPVPGFPKYNVYRMLDGSPYNHFMEFALAGYDKASLDVKMDNGHLVVSSKTDSDKKEDREYTHRGMARRDFSSRYYVGKDVEVRGAKFADGLLTVELEKLVPEEQKPRSVFID